MKGKKYLLRVSNKKMENHWEKATFLVNHWKKSDISSKSIKDAEFSDN